MRGLKVMLSARIFSAWAIACRFRKHRRARRRSRIRSAPVGCV